MRPNVIIYGSEENYTTHAHLQKHLVWLRVIKQSWIICPHMYINVQIADCTMWHSTFKY